MEARSYTEEDIKKFVKDFNNTPIESIHEFLAQHPGFPATIQTLINFNHDNMLIIACHALLTNNICELKKDLLQRVPRWLALHLEVDEDSAVVKNIQGILAAMRYHTEDIMSKSYQISLPDNCYLNLAHAYLSDVNVAAKDFSRSNMPSVRLLRAYLHKVNFSFVNLRDAVFTEAVSTETNFHRANLTNVDFYRCNLTDANFVGADLTNVNFSEATLNGAHFFDSDMITDQDVFTKELDRLFAMLEKHPQLSMLRYAIASDLHRIIEALPATEQAGAYNTAYRHPLLKQHRDLTMVRDFINTMHGWFSWKRENGRVARSPIETRGQKTLAI